MKINTTTMDCMFVDGTESSVARCMQRHVNVLRSVPVQCTFDGSTNEAGSINWTDQIMLIPFYSILCPT